MNVFIIIYTRILFFILAHPKYQLVAILYIYIIIIFGLIKQYQMYNLHITTRSYRIRRRFSEKLPLFVDIFLNFFLKILFEPIMN